MAASMADKMAAWSAGKMGADSMVARTADWTVAQTAYSKESTLVGWMAVPKAERMAASSVVLKVIQ